MQKASDNAARDIFVDQPQSLLGRQDVFVDDAAISEGTGHIVNYMYSIYPAWSINVQFQRHKVLVFCKQEEKT